MVNKSGWFKVFEASIATMLIMGSFLFLLNQASNESDFLGEFRDLKVKNLLENIDLNTSLRESVLKDEKEQISRYFEENLGEQTHYIFEIYPLGGQYAGEDEYNKEVISYSKIISAERNTYSPKVMVLNIYGN